MTELQVAAAKRRRNVVLWAGFGLVLLGLLTYIPIFALYASTRDVPWANYLMFIAGAFLLLVGLRRAFGQPEQYRGKVIGTVFGVLSVLLVGFFCYGIFYAAKGVPSASAAVHTGQTAPDFSLVSADGKQVVLSDLLKTNHGVLLVFYRGYW